MNDYYLTDGQALQVRVALQAQAVKQERYLGAKDLKKYLPATANAAHDYVQTLQALTQLKIKPVTSLDLYDAAITYLNNHT